jgi:hypothetical protein
MAANMKSDASPSDEIRFLGDFKALADAAVAHDQRLPLAPPE